MSADLHTETEASRRSGLGRIGLTPRHVVGLLALTAIVWFAVTNSQRVTVEWFVADTRTPLIVVIVVSAVLGALLARVGVWRRERRERQAAAVWLRSARRR